MAWARVKSWPEWVRVTMMVVIGLVLVVGMFAVYLQVGGDPMPPNDGRTIGQVGSGEQGVEAGVALDHAALHAVLDHAVA